MQAIYAELARIETIVGKDTPLRAYFRTSGAKITVVEPPPQKFGANGLNALQSDLFFYSFTRNADEFYRKCLEPTLQRFSRRDAACLSYLHLEKRLRMHRLMLALMTERMLTNEEMLADFLSSIKMSAAAALKILAGERQNIAVSELISRAFAQETPSVLSLCIFSKKRSQDDDDFEDALVRLPEEVRKLFARHWNIEPASPPVLASSSASGVSQATKEKTPTITAIKDIPRTQFSYNAEEFILQKAAALSKYIGLGEVALTKADKPTKKSLRDMTMICGIAEFFPAQYTDFDTLAAQMTWQILDAAQSSSFAPADDSTPALVKFWVSQLAKQPFSLRKAFVPDYRVALSPRENMIVPQYLAFLRSTPPEGYVPVESLREYARARHSAFSLVAGASEPWRELKMLATPEYQRNRYERFMPMPADKYFDAVTMPILKGLSFVLAAIGAMEIFYDEPFGAPVRHGNLSYITPFDGLRYFRLTPLGRYALASDARLAQEIAERAAAKQTQKNHAIVFDERRLMLWIHRDDIERQATARKFLEPYWRERRGETGSGETPTLASTPDAIERIPYWTNFTAFTKDCSSEREAVQKVQRFIRELNIPYDDMPKVWEGFVRKIVNNSKAPISAESDVKIFKVDKNSPTARALVADPVIGKLVVKAEGYRILVKEKQMQAFQDRLRELGLFLS